MIVGRVVQRVSKESGQNVYLINDNTGTITVIDYKAGDIEAACHKGYTFRYICGSTIRQYGYVRIHGVVVPKTGYELSLELIANVTDYNEVTNHWLNTATAKCIRKYGSLSEEELKSAEATDAAAKAKAPELSEKEKLVRRLEGCW